MADYDTEIVEWILDKTDGPNSDCTHTSTASNLKKDGESGYCSVEDLLNIETFITPDSQLDGFITMSEPNELIDSTFVSNIALAPNKETVFTAPVENDSGNYPNGFVNIGANSSNNDFNESFISDAFSELNKKDLVTKEGQCDEFVNAVANLSDDNLAIDFNESIFSEVLSLTSNDSDSVTQVENKIDDGRKSDPQDGSINAGANHSDDNPAIDSKVSICSDSKNDIPSSDVADSTTKTLRSQNELKSFIQYVKIYCTKCGESPWNVKYKTNSSCQTCETKALLRCSRCDKEYTKYASIMDHLRYRCDPVDTVYQCPDCDYNTRAKSAYTKHLLVHKPTENVECTACGKVLKNKRYLREHKKTYCRNRMNVQKIECPNCSKVFKTEKYLQIHMRDYCPKEYPVQPFRCSGCDGQYKSKKNLLEHQRYYCQNGENVSNLKCSYCSKTFQNELSLRKHMKYIDCQNNKSQEEYAKCPNCSKLYKTEILLRKHQKYYCKIDAHNRKVKCSDCGKELSNDMRLQNHRKRYHNAL